MRRTIGVIYTYQYLREDRDIHLKKRYFFLCDNDEVRVGDIIISSQYSTPMQVVELNNDTAGVCMGIRLSVIQVSSLYHKNEIENLKYFTKEELDKIGKANMFEVPFEDFKEVTIEDSPNVTPKMIENTANSENREKSIMNGLNSFIDQVLSSVSAEEVVNKVMPMIEQKVKDTYGFLPQVHEIKLPTKAYTFTEPLHEKFDEVTAIISQDIPVYLTGKAGTGKNVICKQVAQALGLEFYFTNAVTQEYKLTGFIDANGKYQETQFYKAFTKGGLFFLDEMDASIPETLVILNAAIANRYFDFPIGKVEANPNFRVVAAGNTVGTGADNEYTGRFCLDEASLDRFAMVEIGYSRQIEESLSLGDNDLISFAHIFRDVTDKAGIKCLFSYRTISRIAKLKDCLPLKEVLKISLLKGLDEDDINILKNELRDRGLSSNKYGSQIINS